MSTRIIPFAYKGEAVSFNTDGWINATEAAARFAKLPHEWLRLRAQGIGSDADYQESLLERNHCSNI